MDDCICLCRTKEEAHAVLDAMAAASAEIGLRFNPAKTEIVKASKGFTFLKIRYAVKSSGKVVKTLDKAGIRRMRRKLKAFQQLVRAGEISAQVAFDSFMSWFGNASYAQSYRTRKNMLRNYNSKFKRYRAGGVFA